MTAADRDPFQAEFEDFRPAPRDVVMRRGMTAEALRDFNHCCNADQPIRNGGAMTFDADGRPEGMEPTEQYDRELVGVYVIDRRLIRKLGLNPDELTNAHIIDN